MGSGKRGVHLLVAAVVGATLSLGSTVLGFGAPEEQPRRGGVLRVADEAPGGPFGVPWKMPVFGIIPAVPVYETLLWVDARGQVSPKLASQWEVTPDRKGIIFRLRQGVRFHDGSELDADAVKFSLEENLKARRLPPTIRSVDVLDRSTVRVNLSQWNNGIYLSLAGSASLIASPTHIRRLGEERAVWEPSGTGPFRLTQYDPNAFAMYTRFDRYWDRGKPYLDRLELWFIRSIQTLKAAMLAGQVDVAGFGDPQVVSELQATGRFRVISGLHRGILMLIPDSANEDSPFADRRVREALQYAFDRAALARALGYGLWEPWDQIAHPESPAALKDDRRPAYSPARARELLAQAGYPNGFRTKLIPAHFLTREIAVAIHRYLQEVGIEAELETPEIARYAEYQRRGWRGLLVQPFGYFPYFNNYVAFYFTNSPEGFVSMRRPPQLQRLWEDSVATLTPQRYRLQLMHRLLLQEHTVIPLWLAGRYYVTRPEARGTGHLQGSTWPWWTPANAWVTR